MGGRLGLISGSPQISQAVNAGWFKNVHRGQGKRPSVEVEVKVVARGTKRD